jgi:hypothetical protein
MLARHHRDGLSPREGFNILYFFQSTIRLLLAHHHEITLGPTNYPYPCEPIRAVNCPTEFDDADRNRKLWTEYVRCVNADSVPTGEEFDVGYAISILSSAIGGNGMLDKSRTETTGDKADADEWLAGFNSN